MSRLRVSALANSARATRQSFIEEGMLPETCGYRISHLANGPLDVQREVIQRIADFLRFPTQRLPHGVCSFTADLRAGLMKRDLQLLVVDVWRCRRWSIRAP